MKEYLHLFTKVEGWKPEQNGQLWICLDKDLRPCTRLHKVGYKWHGTTDPVYVLDLSKLTTKERVVTEIKDAECLMAIVPNETKMAYGIRLIHTLVEEMKPKL